MELTIGLKSTDINIRIIDYYLDDVDFYPLTIELLDAELRPLDALEIVKNAVFETNYEYICSEGLKEYQKQMEVVL